MSNKVIEVTGLKKSFILPSEQVRSIKSFFTNITRLGKVKYRRQKALNGVDFDVKEGEFFGIVGRNGSGKSTLLKILAGIYQPTEGKISTKGKIVPFIELGVGFNPELTGRENVYLNGAMLGFNEKQVSSKYQEIVEFAELKDFMDQKLKNYSSGMQVRLAFSVATILAESDILLLDEVLAVGDAEFQRKCFNYFNTLKKKKKTVVFVSHDMNAVKEYCDRAILIEDGKVTHEGTPAKIAREYAKLFIPEEQKMRKGGKGLRWGNEDLVFESIDILPKKIEYDDIRLSVTLKANKDVPNPIIGFSIKNGADQFITGTNTKIANLKTGVVEKGKTITIIWEVENVFNDGLYYLNVAAESEDQIACDWWEEASTFNVYKNTTTGFAVHLPIKTILKK